MTMAMERKILNTDGPHITLISCNVIAVVYQRYTMAHTKHKRRGKKPFNIPVAESAG